METLETYLKNVTAGEPVEHKNLTLVPLWGERHGALDYILAADAIGSGSLSIMELGESGSVPELRAVNKADTMILLLDGEELVGAKQNRILNTTVLLPAKSKTTIPVSCVEQGRWRHTSREFRSGGYSPSHLRARKSRDVGRSLRAEGRAVSDQGTVWESVAENLAGVGAASPTMAMHDAVEQRRDSLEDYMKALPCPADARGVFVAIGAKFAAVDLFDRPDTLCRVWPRLVMGYALDALARLDREEKPFSPKGPQVILERAGQIPCEPCPSVGVGQDMRFEAEDLVGQALVAEGVCVHLSIFPNDDENRRYRRRVNGPRIQPPSDRRENRHRSPDNTVE